MKAVSDICLLFLMLHTPGVLSLSTRKLHADVQSVRKKVFGCIGEGLVFWGRRGVGEEEVVFGYKLLFFFMIHRSSSVHVSPRRSYCKHLWVTLSCSGVHDFRDNKSWRNGFEQQCNTFYRDANITERTTRFYKNHIVVLFWIYLLF